MALNIPMPRSAGQAFSSSFDSGALMGNRLMQDLLQKAQMKQAAEQFQQNYALSKAREDRASALQPYMMQSYGDRHKLLQQQIQSAIHKNDPMWELNQIKAMEAAFNGSPTANKQDTAAQLPPDNALSPEGSIYPTASVLGEEPLIFDPNRGKRSPEMPASSGASNGLNVEMFKQHPMLRGWVKHKYGIDPLAVDSGSALHGPARDASDLEKLKNEAGENSEVYLNAKAAYDATLDAKKDLRDLRARTKQGLKTGEKEFFDENTGAPLGKEIPLTAKERESEQGNILFNQLYPYVYKGASPFSGEGSITRLQQAAAHYKTDPKARELFDNYLLADKMLAATTVNEAATLKAGHTNRTYAMLKDSLEAQDIPKVVKKLIKEYDIPMSAQLRAGMSYQKILSDARQKSKRETPATQKLFYNPEMQQQHTSQNEAPSIVRMTKGNKKYDIPADKVADALKEGFARE